MVTKVLLVAGTLAIAMWFTAGAVLANEEGAKAEPSGTVVLPEAAAKAIADTWPKATVAKVWLHELAGLAIYTVELRDGSAELKVFLDGGGRIQAVMMPIEFAVLPDVISKAITAAAKDATITSVARKEIRAQITNEKGSVAKLVPLPKSRLEYIAELAREGKVGSVVIGQDGLVVLPIKWQGARVEAEKPSGPILERPVKPEGQGN